MLKENGYNSYVLFIKERGFQPRILTFVHHINRGQAKNVHLSLLSALTRLGLYHDDWRMAC